MPESLDWPAGTWVMFMEDSSCITTLGQSFEQRVWSWYVVGLEDLGAGGEPDHRFLGQRMRLCSQETTPIVNLQTFIPDAVIDSLPEGSVPGYLLGADAGDVYHTGELLEQWGLAGLEPDQALPSDPDAPEVFDQDGDGMPGVSLIVGDGLCEIWLVQRTRLRFSGAIVDGARVEGTMWSLIEKRILGGSRPLCRSEIQVSPTPAPSTFVMLRADGLFGAVDLDLDGDGEVSCAEVGRARPELLELGVGLRTEPDDSICR